MPAVRAQSTRTIVLPTSKQLAEPVPGSPQRLNSLPMTAALSPDGRYLAVVNAGYGTFESQYQQSIAVIDIQSGKLTDFPEPRTAKGLPQTLYSGLAFGKDGRHLYAVFDSLTAPQGKSADQTGNAIAVYDFNDGRVKAEQLLPVPVTATGGREAAKSAWRPFAPRDGDPLAGRNRGAQGAGRQRRIADCGQSL